MYVTGHGIQPWRAPRAGGMSAGVRRLLAATAAVACVSVGFALGARGSAPAHYTSVVVQPGDTLWSIAERYYGAGDEFDRLVDANAGRSMSDGRAFERAGLIYPGWELAVPLAIEDVDGSQWYVVRRGDTLRGIAALVL